MRELGWENDEIEVRVPSVLLNEKEANEYLIRSNKNTGEWDFDILANDYDLEFLEDCGFEKADFGLDNWESNLDEGGDEPPPSPDTEIIKLQVRLGQKTEILPIINAALKDYDVTVL